MEGKTLTARMGRVENRLDGIDTRLDGVDNRLDNIDARLNGIDARLDGIDARLDGIDARLDSIDVRLDKKFDSIDKKFDSIDRKFDAVDKRFNGIDNQLEKMSVMLVRHDHDIQEIKVRLNSIDETLKMFHKFQETLDVLVGYFKDNRQEVIMMEPRFQRLETRVDKLEVQFAI